MRVEELINTNPDAFMEALDKMNSGFSLEYAYELDAKDPQNYLKHCFNTGLRYKTSRHLSYRLRHIIPFAGHSLGPHFDSTDYELRRIHRLQSERLHEGHFPKTKAQGGNWFDYDIEPEAIKNAQAILGFADPCEFIYTQAGLSDNLRLLLSTFYRPSLADWHSQKAGICFLGKEFFSDQAVIHSLLKGEIQRAKANNIFTDVIPCPIVNDLCMTISADERGLYDEEKIIDYVKEHADYIKILHLSDIVFSTGQRINLKRVLGELRDVLQQHHIIVGLDLAHTVGNRLINLKELPVTYAVGCSYKHISGSAGSGFGIYVNKDADLKKNPPIQGWKAAASDKVFPVIDQYDPHIMNRKGAWAFRCSNPSPVALIPVLHFLSTMNRIGWDTLMNRSESLTRYMVALLQKRLGDKIEIITPLAPDNRGAMIVFRIKNLTDIAAVEELMKENSEFGSFDIDTRPPNNVRLTAHFGYCSFVDIRCMVMRLEQVINLRLNKEHPRLNRVTSQELEFGTQLGLLHNKIRDFSRRMEWADREGAFSDFCELHIAHAAALTLHEGLRDARNHYFRGHKNPQILKKECAALFKNARVVLDEHRGWSDILTTVMLGLLTLGVGLLARQAFFMLHKTETTKILNGFEESLGEIITKPEL